MFRLGLSSCGKTIGDELFHDYAEAGITAMELTPHYLKYDEVDYEGTRRLADKYGVELWSFHLQFYPEMNIADPSVEARERAIGRLFDQIGRASDAGIRRMVIHPCSGPIADSERSERMKISKESLCRLADRAESCGAVLAVEDLPRTNLGHNSAEMLELLSADERLRVCFDTNHLVNEAGHDFVRALGKKIITLHVSDYDFVDEKHWLPGEGKVDWDALVNALVEVGYDGVWMYEVEFAPPGNVPRTRDLTCADFVENARAIFESAGKHA